MPTLTSEQVARIVKLRGEGKTYKQLHEATGHAISTINRVLQGHKSKKKATKKAKKKAKPRKTGRTDAMPRPDEKDYLLWALHGALNGWVDRIIRDIRDDKFAS